MTATTEHDAPTPEALVAAMDAAIAQGFTCFVKWTCPKCKERVTSFEANIFHAAGYYHDKPGCGAPYTGPAYGFSAILGPPDTIRQLAEEANRQLPGYEGTLPGLNAEHN